MNYNNFCKEKDCAHYTEWEDDFDSEIASPCVSCKIIGYSYDITEYPPDCEFLEEIKKYKGDGGKQ